MLKSLSLIDSKRCEPNTNMSSMALSLTFFAFSPGSLTIYFSNKHNLVLIPLPLVLIWKYERSVYIWPWQWLLAEMLKTW